MYQSRKRKRWKSRPISIHGCLHVFPVDIPNDNSVDFIGTRPIAGSVQNAVTIPSLTFFRNQMEAIHRMSSRCPYANLFGAPGTGAHQYRFFGIAIVDTVLTIFAAALIAYFGKYSFVYTFLILFFVGEVLHYAFGTQTAILSMLGIKAC